MKIGFISYEYPPETAAGGIATYVQQAAKMLSRRGHEVDVFAACYAPPGEVRVDEEDDGEKGSVRVHRLGTASHRAFATEAAPYVAARHRQTPFDVLEGPDYGADGDATARLLPDLPYVVKLHTPTALYQLFNGMAPWKVTARQTVAAIRDGAPLRGRERANAHLADEISAPSNSIAEMLIARWDLPRERVHLLPLPYAASPEMLAIPVETQTGRVTFLGRVEFKKGVIDLAHAVPLVLREHPSAKFRFVGRPVASPDPKRDMQTFLCDELGAHRDAVEFTGPVPLAEVPRLLAETDVCVFPSHWESFGLVCLEAMAAGRAVVGSQSGGMADMLAGGCGELVPPKSPGEIARAVNDLLGDSDKRTRLGTAARARVQSDYNTERIGRLQEEGYERAIAHKRMFSE